LSDVFISYSRKDRNFVLKLHDALAKLNRDTWVDWQDIPLTADFRREILAGIEGADSFVFIISPESVISAVCREEIAHAVVSQKRLVPIFYRNVPDDNVPKAFASINWIFFRETDDFDSSFASLVDALDTDLDWRRSHTRLLVRAVEWAAKARDSSRLLRGMDVQDAFRWLAEAANVKKQEPTALQLEYIQASQEWEAGEIQRLKELNEEKERQRQEAERQSLIARGRELTAYAEKSLTKDPECSLLLSLHALEITRRAGAVLVEVEEVTHSALLASRVRLALSGHEKFVNTVVWSPDGRLLATASDDGTAKVWDSSTGQEVLTLSGHEHRVNNIAWRPDGKLLVTASADATAKVWDVATGRLVLTLPRQERWVFWAAWSPDGSRLATASMDRMLKVWDASTGRELLAVSGHEKSVLCVMWSPDGGRLATASEDQTARVWEAETGRLLLTLAAGPHEFFKSVAWSPDGERLATASQSGGVTPKISVWEAASGRELLTLSADVNGLAWSPEGERLAVAGLYGANVLQPETGRELVKLSDDGHSASSVAWSPDGKRLASAGGNIARVWEPATTRELLAVDGSDAEFSSVAWSPDGKYLAAAGADHSVKVWDVRTGEAFLTLRGHTGAVHSVAWAPDGQFLATAGADHTVRIWEVAPGCELLKLSNNIFLFGNVAWSPDGKRLAAASGSGAQVWDASTGCNSLNLRRDMIYSVAWSPDGQRLATGSRDTKARIFDANTGQELLVLSGHTWDVQSVTWSPDGLRLATAGRESVGKVWDARTGQELVTLAGHQQQVFSAEWRPDGWRLATTSEDRTVKLWDPITGMDLFTLPDHERAVRCLAWSPDGKCLAAGSTIIHVYAMDIDLLASLARTRVTRNLTLKECSKYLHVNEVPPIPFG
jgi:WD40 repeat protein